MNLVEFIGLGLLVAVVLLIAVVPVRRSLLSRSGGVDVSWRARIGGDRWILGQARFSGDDLLLFRAFSLLPMAARTLHRQTLVLGTRRAPVGTESDLLPPSSVIVRCTDAGSDVELALSEDALTGLQSWLESAPTGFRGTPGAE